MSQLDTTYHPLNILCTNCKDVIPLRIDDYGIGRTVSGKGYRLKGVKIHYVDLYVECLNCGNKFHFSSYLS